VPNTLLTNVAKVTMFAHNYHQAVQIVQDLAGGLLVTAPAAEDSHQRSEPRLRTQIHGRREGLRCGKAAAAAEPDQRI